jgi:hypothetical protein
VEGVYEKSLAGKSILTFVLVGGAMSAFLADWNAAHVFNPLWLPHARYHIAVNMFFLAGVAGVATWLLWRPSREPGVAFTTAALFPLHSGRRSSMCRFSSREPPAGPERLVTNPVLREPSIQTWSYLVSSYCLPRLVGGLGGVGRQTTDH